MKKWIFIFFVTFISSQISAQTLHVLLFVNEQDVKIGGKIDLENMSLFFKKVADCIGYDYKLSKNSNANFTAVSVNKEINNLRVGVNDIVVFYYSGHGYNQGRDKWPTLDFNDNNYWLSDILTSLNTKTENAKLVLCIADCCNKVYERALAPTATFNPISNENMRELFTGFAGKRTIVISSSKQGEYSYGNIRYGGFFSFCFRNAIDSCTDNSATSPTWDKVMSNAINSTQRMANAQTPQYEIIIKSDPFE